MPAPAQKKPLKPKAPTAPKGPSAKSKTGNSACSAAASNWQLAIRGKASINPDTYQTLAKCRAMTRTSKNAEGRARAGYNLSDQGAAAIKGRLQSRFDRNLITQKSRDARVKELLAQRKEKQTAVGKQVSETDPKEAIRNRIKDLSYQISGDIHGKLGGSGRISKRAAKAYDARLEAKMAERRSLEKQLQPPELITTHEDKLNADIARNNNLTKDGLVSMVSTNNTNKKLEKFRPSARSYDRRGIGTNRPTHVVRSERNEMAKKLLAGRAAKQAAPVAKPAAESKSPIRPAREPEIVEKRKFIAAKVKEAYRRAQDNPDFNDLQLSGPGLQDVKSVPKVGYRNSVKDAEDEIENRSGGYGITRTLTQKSQTQIRIDKAEDAGARQAMRAAISRRDTPAPAPAPAPARYSLGGQLAPGRGQDSPEYNFRALRVRDKIRPRIAAIDKNLDNDSYGDWGAGTLSNRMAMRAQELTWTSIRLKKHTKELELAREPLKAPAPATTAPKENPTTFQPKTVHVFDTYQQGSGEMKRGYVAKITGTHPKYNLERQFLNGPNDRGTKTVTIKERGIYEMQSKDLNKPGSTERTYELHGRNKVRTIHESLNPRTHHVPIEDNKSIGRVARLLTLFGKKKAAAPASPQAAPVAKPAAAPAPAKFSRNGELAPGRGQDDPSYGNRALRVHDKAHARSKVLMKGVDGTRSTRWEQQQRSNELRVTVDNLRPAVIRKIQKDIDAEKAAAPAPPQAAPMAAKPAASSGTTLKPVKKKGDTSQQITKASISSTTSKGSDFLTPVTEQRHQMLSVRNTVTKIKAKDRARAESQSGVQTLKTSQLTADPNQFQYKMNTAGPVGVTDQFKETRVWNKELAGVVQVWKSPTENKTFVVNGHHRYELAQRLGVSKLNVQYIQAQSPAEARMKGALTNIAEGRGTSVDAAKFFRDQPNVQDWSKELKAKGISLSERTASEGLALKDVHPKIWRDVVNEMTPLSRAVSIGKSGLKQEDQLNIYNRSTAGNWTSGKTSEFATELKNSARTKVKSGSLFGDDEEVSVFEHRAALSDRLKNRLSSDKSLFSKVARGRNASRIESVGSNKIDKESSATRASEADNALMAFDRERKYSGRVNNELNNFGQRIAKGEKIDKIYNDFEKRMTQTLRLMNSGKFDRRAARLKAIAK